MNDDDRVVLLIDAEGNHYLLPWAILEGARVAPDKVGELRRELGAEVQGHMPPSFTGQLVPASAFLPGQQYGRTFDPARFYARVQLQQGHTQTDADWPK